MTANRDPMLQFQLEQFYYQEADLLDSRQFKQWLKLFAADAKYLMPARYSPQRDASQRDSEDFLSTESEFEGFGADACPYREESLMILAFRVDRALKINAWGSNPPARTRRQISNVLISQLETANHYELKSNFLLYYSRHRTDNFIYSGQRIDRIIHSDDETTITQREIRLDWNVVPVPTLGLFF